MNGNVNTFMFPLVFCNTFWDAWKRRASFNRSSETWVCLYVVFGHVLTYLRDMFLYSVLFFECNFCESTVVLYRTAQQQYSCLIPHCNMLICDPHGIAYDFFNHFGRHLINF